MGIVVASLGIDYIRRDERGLFPLLRSFVASGLTAAASNAVPHGMPKQPRRVWFAAAGNGVQAAEASLDTSQGAADPTGALPGGRLGYDATNIYVFAPAGVTVVEIHAEFEAFGW